jgi:methionyl-tRNA synthetase
VTRHRLKEATLTERIHVGVAWPYANGPLHLGHIAGAYLPADIFARFNRIIGNEVLMVSGSDQHGAPITIRAEKEHTTPADIAEKYHAQFVDCWEKLGISWDLYTTTGTANHAEVTQDIFLTLLEKGYLYKNWVLQAYCPSCQRFLPDRYVVGICPNCGSLNARGDECEACGKPLDPVELKEPHCVVCKGTPRFEQSEHFFLRLSAFQEQLVAWVNGMTHWRPNVMGATRRFLDEGLRDRAITRDIDWGIPVPVPGFEGKRIYVWFEACIGYLSATKEWSKLQGNDRLWERYWKQEAKIYNFIGKDNIFFHTLSWPATLMGYGGLNLPYDVPANEFLNIQGQKLSTSRNWAVWVHEYLERFDPDPLRYFLAAAMPETQDSDFTWEKFVRRNNDELVATYGNLAHRVLTFTQRQFGGVVPDPGALDDASEQLIRESEQTLGSVRDALQRCSFKEGIRDAMALAQKGNRYLDEQAPWKAIKQSREIAGRSVYTIICVLSVLSTVLNPYLPFSSAALHRSLGFTGTLMERGWKMERPVPGQALGEVKPLFVKLDDAVIEQETARLGT